MSAFEAETVRYASPLRPQTIGATKRTLSVICKSLFLLQEIGAGEEDRTLDINLGKVALYR